MRAATCCHILCPCCHNNNTIAKGPGKNRDTDCGKNDSTCSALPKTVRWRFQCKHDDCSKSFSVIVLAKEDGYPVVPYIPVQTPGTTPSHLTFVDPAQHHSFSITHNQAPSFTLSHPAAATVNPPVNQQAALNADVPHKHPNPVAGALLPAQADSIQALGAPQAPVLQQGLSTGPHNAQQPVASPCLSVLAWPRLDRGLTSSQAVGDTCHMTASGRVPEHNNLAAVRSTSGHPHMQEADITDPHSSGILCTGLHSAELPISALPTTKTAPGQQSCTVLQPSDSQRMPQGHPLSHVLVAETHKQKLPTRHDALESRTQHLNKAGTAPTTVRHTLTFNHYHAELDPIRQRDQFNTRASTPQARAHADHDTPPDIRATVGRRDRGGVDDSHISQHPAQGCPYPEPQEGQLLGTSSSELNNLQLHLLQVGGQPLQQYLQCLVHSNQADASVTASRASKQLHIQKEHNQSKQPVVSTASQHSQLHMSYAAGKTRSQAHPYPPEQVIAQPSALTAIPTVKLTQAPRSPLSDSHSKLPKQHTDMPCAQHSAGPDQQPSHTARLHSYNHEPSVAALTDPAPAYKHNSSKQPPKALAPLQTQPAASPTTGPTSASAEGISNLQRAHHPGTLHAEQPQSAQGATTGTANAPTQPSLSGTAAVKKRVTKKQKTAATLATADGMAAGQLPSPTPSAGKVQPPAYKLSSYLRNSSILKVSFEDHLVLDKKGQPHRKMLQRRHFEEEGHYQIRFEFATGDTAAMYAANKVDRLGTHIRVAGWQHGHAIKAFFLRGDHIPVLHASGVDKFEQEVANDYGWERDAASAITEGVPLDCDGIVKYWGYGKVVGVYHTPNAKLCVPEVDIYVLILQYVHMDLQEFLFREEIKARGDAEWAVQRYQYAQKFTRQLLTGLDALQSVPRDSLSQRHYRCKNILIDDGMDARLADFAARSTQRDDTGNVKVVDVVTLMNDLIAPELAHEDTDWEQSLDAWGIGCVALEMFTDQPPFGAKPSAFTFCSETDDGIEAVLSRFASKVPAPAMDFIRECLVKSRQGRLRIKDLLKHHFVTAPCTLPTATAG